MARSLLGRPVIQAQSACLSLSPITPSSSVCIPASPGHHQNSLLGGAHALPPPISVRASTSPPPPAFLVFQGPSSGCLLSAAALSAIRNGVRHSLSFRSTSGSVSVLTVSALCISWFWLFLSAAGLEAP